MYWHTLAIKIEMELHIRESRKPNRLLVIPSNPCQSKSKMAATIHQNTYVVPALRRSSRQASRVASERISRIIADEVPEEKFVVPPPNPGTDVTSVPPSTRYSNANLLRYYLNCSENGGSETRTESAIKIFETLLTDQKILAENPKFRSVVMAKIIQFRELIEKQERDLERSGLSLYINSMTQRINTSIANKSMREKMLRSVDELSHCYSDYRAWVQRDRLKAAMNVVEEMINSLPSVCATV